MSMRCHTNILCIFECEKKRAVCAFITRPAKTILLCVYHNAEATGLDRSRTRRDRSARSVLVAQDGAPTDSATVRPTIA